MSFSVGAGAVNLSDVLACGLASVTVCPTGPKYGRSGNRNKSRLYMSRASLDSARDGYYFPASRVIRLRTFLMRPLVSRNGKNRKILRGLGELGENMSPRVKKILTNIRF